ncbi:hypothetical protein PMAYCL1PPCAC_15967, partial [Pristionchus mayeri]
MQTLVLPVLLAPDLLGVSLEDGAARLHSRVYVRSVDDVARGRLEGGVCDLHVSGGGVGSERLLDLILSVGALHALEDECGIGRVELDDLIEANRLHRMSNFGENGAENGAGVLSSGHDDVAIASFS